MSVNNNLIWELAHHSGEEFIYVLEGAIIVHTEFYDPVVLQPGESIYVDSNMGHAYVAEDCDEAVVMGVCSSSDESLMQSLMSLHGDATVTKRTEPRRLARTFPLPVHGRGELEHRLSS